MIEKLHTTDEAAEILRVKPSTIRKWINEKKLRAKKFGHSWIISETEIKRFWEAQK